MKCRHCAAELSITMVDLGSAPPSNAYLEPAALRRPEKWYPLRVLVCDKCWLAQTEDFLGADELFSPDYAYFSSYSTTWLAHTKRYVEDMVRRFRLNENSMVVEVAANDGYLLQYVKEKNIPCIGIEPTASTAAAARGRGVEVIEEFFGTDLAQRLSASGYGADLMAANNVLAHVPDINDFAAGFSTLLKPRGVATFEFPHLLNLVKENQFDTIYHEHYSYLSLTAVNRIFRANGLDIFDVDELPTHGGSLRVYAQRLDTGKQLLGEGVEELLARERDAGVCTPEFYGKVQERANSVKLDLLGFLVDARRRGLRVGAYGAAAKGNTLLNFVGVRPDLLPYVADRNEAKQNKYLPGSRIPIVPEDCLRNDRPDRVLILPWNLAGEIKEQLSYITDWGGHFATAIPSLAETSG